jgi:hypothetical protein
MPQLTIGTSSEPSSLVTIESCCASHERSSSADVTAIVLLPFVTSITGATSSFVTVTTRGATARS